MESALSVIDVVHVEASSFQMPSTPEAFLHGLQRPTAFFVRGQDQKKLRVIAGSLHGNEPSGFRAIHRTLIDIAVRGERPATNVWLFVGGVEAAKLRANGLRMPPGRRDLNRCFAPPFDGIDGAVGEMALRLFREVPPEAVVDLHNNTGLNPAYTVTPALAAPHLWIGQLFATRFVHSTLKLGTFAEAFEDLAPSLTVECGMAGRPEADATAYAGLRRLLAAPQIEHAFVSTQPLQVLADSVRVSLASGSTLAFADAPEPDAHVTLDPGIDRHNFEFLSAGVALGWIRTGGSWPLVAIDEAGADRSAELFALDGDVLRVRRSFVPIMMTTSVEAALSDCLFYATTRRE